MSTLRVRQILSNLNQLQRAALKKLLPPKLSVPDVPTCPYPAALRDSFSEDAIGRYAHLGLFTEQLLHQPSGEIHMEGLLEVLRGYLPDCTDAVESKIQASVSTQPYLDCVRATRQQIESVLRSTSEEGPLKYEEEIVHDTVSGHPDMWNKTQVFEIKTTGLLKDNWVSFLFQVFAYGALLPSVKDLYLVLPLQKLVWHYNIENWTKRAEYRDFLTSWALTAQTDRATAHVQASLLCASHGIGCHIGKQKTLAATICSLPNFYSPYQIFLSGNRGYSLKADKKDIAETKKLIGQTGVKIFVHSPYGINLSHKPEKNEEGEDDAWHEALLIKNLQICREMGGKGVVVHVGKSVKMDKGEAMEQMRGAILRCLEHATPECPLLLETPAGQGTELLSDKKEFIEFVESFASPRLRICVDTCHVFAAGHDPKLYLEDCLARPGLLHLVHYNDSLVECGKCVDKHASIFTGEGFIGFPKMSEIAELCSEHSIPMIIE